MPFMKYPPGTEQSAAGVNTQPRDKSHQAVRVFTGGVGGAAGRAVADTDGVDALGDEDRCCLVREAVVEVVGREEQVLVATQTAASRS